MLQNQPATAWSKGTTERSACSTNGNPPELAMVRGGLDLSLALPLGDLAGFIQRDPDARGVRALPLREAESDLAAPEREGEHHQHPAQPSLAATSLDP